MFSRRSHRSHSKTQDFAEEQQPKTRDVHRPFLTQLGLVGPDLPTPTARFGGGGGSAAGPDVNQQNYQHASARFYGAPAYPEKST